MGAIDQSCHAWTYSDVSIDHCAIPLLSVTHEPVTCRYVPELSYYSLNLKTTVGSTIVSSNGRLFGQCTMSQFPLEGAVHTIPSDRAR